MDVVIPPFAIRYDGLDADRNAINAVYLGQSMMGAGKLYTALSHYAFLGTIPRGNYRKEFICYAKPPTSGSYDAWLYIATAVQQYHLGSDLYSEAAKFVFSQIVGAVKSFWTKPTKVEAVVGQLANVLIEQARINAETHSILANGIVRSNDQLASLHGRLIDTLPELARATRPSGRELVAPIGLTCKTIVQFPDTASADQISEAEADVIRGNEEMELGNMQTFRCNQITELNKQTGHCIMELEGFSRPVKGTIHDPSLKIPHNVYTSSLDSFSAFEVEAKPVFKSGELHRIYVMDARLVE